MPQNGMAKAVQRDAMKVEKWMYKDVQTLTEENSLRDAINLSQSQQIRHIPIVGKGQELVGIVSDRDIKRFTPSILTEKNAGKHERVLEETPLGRIMTRDPLTVSPFTLVRDAVEMLCQKKVGALPVVSNGKLVGIISNTDILRALSEVLALAKDRQS